MTPRQRLALIVPGALFLVAFGAFELGRWAGENRAEFKPPQPKPEQKDDAGLIESLLAQNLEERRFDFPVVVQSSTGQAVKPFDHKDPAATTILAAVCDAAEETLVLHNGPDSPLRGLRRINEASRFFEDALRIRLDRHPDLFCTVPTTADGHGQRSGYPDLRIEHVESGTIAYLDPKLFEDTSRASTLRTFYYTPRVESSKVREDAYHLLLGFSHDGNDGVWTFKNWDLIDLSKLEVRLKAEFQASNRDLYREEARLVDSHNVDEQLRRRTPTAAASPVGASGKP